MAVGKPEAQVALDLALFRLSLALKLLIDLIGHVYAGSPDRVAKALEAAVTLTGYLAVKVIETRVHILPGPSHR